MREKVEALKDHPDFGALPGDVLFVIFDQLPIALEITDHVAVDVDVPAVDLFQVVDAAQEGAFARARRPNDDHHLVLADFQVDIL